MTIFDDAILKEKIKNLPTEYVCFSKHHNSGKKVSWKNLEFTIKVKDIDSVTLNDEKWLNTNNYPEFELFVNVNFYKISIIETIRLGVHYTYYLKNGLLHNGNSAAVIISDRITDSLKHYFIKGVEINEKDFKQIIREKKLNRIIKPLD